MIDDDDDDAFSATLDHIFLVLIGR